MRISNLLLFLLCVLVLWNILDQRGMLSFDLTADDTPWLLWVNTTYLSPRREKDSEWEIEDTFQSKKECMSWMRSDLRSSAARSASREAMLESLSPQDRSPQDRTRTKVIARIGFVSVEAWDEKEKRWELSSSRQYWCLPAGTDPRPKGKE